MTQTTDSDDEMVGPGGGFNAKNVIGFKACLLGFVGEGFRVSTAAAPAAAELFQD